MKKLIASAIVLGTLLLSAPSAHALTLSDLQKEVESLRQEITSLKSLMSGQALSAVIPVATVDVTYSLGMKSPELIKYQQALIDQKYLLPGNATGVFGPLTYAAVVSYQKAKGLPVDGVLGAGTQTSLIAISGGPELACIPNSWVKRANFGGVGRQGPFGFSIGSKGYIGGGSIIDSITGQASITADFWEYNSSTNIWTQKANYGTSSTNPNGLPRAEATGFSIGAKGYVGTGYWVTSTNNIKYAKDFYEYSPTTNIWTPKANFGGTERDGAVGFAIGSKGYLGTGDFRDDFWEYDPATDTWAEKAPFAGGKRSGAVGFAIGGKGYVGTGDLSPANNTNLKDFWEFDPTVLPDGKWTQKADFGGEAWANGTGFALNGKGYIQLRSDFQEYNPGTDTWIKKANFPLPYLLTEVGFAIGKNGYIGGGNNSGTRTKDFWMYCPGIPN